MKTCTDRRTPRRVRTMLALALASGLVSMGGCDGSEDSQTLLTRAADQLEILSAGTSAPPDPAYAKRVYATVRSTLAPVLAAGLPAEQAAANLLIAETQLGEAADASATASAATQGMFDRLADARAIFARWQAVDARATALENLTTDGEIDKARKAINESQTLENQRQAEHAELAEQITGHRAVIDEMVAQITDRRNKAATLRLEADGLSATDAVTLVRQSLWYGREADSFEMDAELIRLEVQRLSPRADALTIEIDNLARQQESLTEVVARLLLRDTQTQAEASKARRHASSLAEQLDGLLFGGDGLAGFRAGALADQTQTAIAAYTKANATARAAQNEMRSQAQMSIARAQQSIARLHWMHARTLESYQVMLADLSAIPDYADADDNSAYKGEIEQIATRIDEALTAASTAYEAARSALDAIGARDPKARASIQAAQQLLSASAQATGDRTIDLATALDNARREAEANATVETADTTPVAAGTGGDGSLESVVDQMLSLIGQGQLARTADLYEFSNPQMRTVFVTGAGMFDATVRLENACQARFGQGLSSLGGGNMMDMDVAAALAKFKALRAADLRIEQTGDTAIVHFPDQSDLNATQPISFVRRDGKWLATIDDADADMAVAQAMMPMLAGMATAFDQIAKRVEGGEFNSIQEVGMALGQAMMGGFGGGG